jgi:hypothetical protein
MKTFVLLVSMMAATTVWGQADKSAAKPPTQEAAKPASAKMATRKSNPKRMEDARHCLGRATNTEIIKCAEAYL